MKLRMDLLDATSPAGIEAIQLTDESVPSAHVYMEAQIFTPDSKRFVLHRSAHAHGSDMNDPEHRYLLCDLEDDGRLSPLTSETGATAPSISPDGRIFYYFVNETAITGGRLTLKKVNLDGTGRETLMSIGATIPGTHYTPSKIYPLSTISPDGKRIALSCYLGDGSEENAPWGLMVFDLTALTVRLILTGQTWCNLHPQYSRNPERGHDLLIQENHGNVAAKDGKCVTLVSGRACDIHVIRDDGTDLRDMPWGRNNKEFCQGHQCWRGRSDWGICGTIVRELKRAPLIEGTAGPHAFHVGVDTPEARRNDISRSSDAPLFYHFGTDASGRHLATDCGASKGDLTVVAAELGQPGEEAATRWIHLLHARSAQDKAAHLHPFLSPDGTKAFFNSNESGVLQAYLIRGLENVFRP